ncbi:hypothetical protein Tsubulata_043626, partial [Turnera subulata]
FFHPFFFSLTDVAGALCVFFSQIHLFLKSLILPNPSLSLQSKSNRRSLLRRCRGHRARHHRRHSFLHPFVFGWWRTDAVSTPTPPTPTTAPSPASPSSVGFEETLRGVQSLYQIDQISPATLVKQFEERFITRRNIRRNWRLNTVRICLMHPR